MYQTRPLKRFEGSVFHDVEDERVYKSRHQTEVVCYQPL
jgi:hypothetical protein